MAKKGVMSALASVAGGWAWVASEDPMDERETAEGEPTEDPVKVLEVGESGYLIDPSWSAEQAWQPTWRDILEQDQEFDQLSRRQQIALLEEDYGFEFAGLTPYRRRRRWSQEVEPWLAEAVPWDQLPPYWRDRLGPHSLGFALYEALDSADAKAAGLFLVEGEFPGGDDTAKVKLRGSVERLNAVLRRRRLRFVVRDKGKG